MRNTTRTSFVSATQCQKLKNRPGDLLQFQIMIREYKTTMKMKWTNLIYPKCEINSINIIE
jgi:hypothetical protein